ncbi:RNA polymerase sigma factor [Tundrisphaera lichenicola]|uniref:RNA polymerase sigma factor n=1 Tax=Tundrisphaera lichenicola TaxID=2029860 RepID=UPI003EB81C6A
MRPDEDVTSTTLLALVRANEQDAWGRLVALYGPLLRYWCRRGGVRYPDDDDVMQEVFQAISAGIDGFRRNREGDTFRGWLRGVTRNKILDWHRRRRRRPEEAAGGTLAVQALCGPPPAPDDDAGERREHFGVCHRAMDRVRSEFESKTWDAFWRATIEGHDTAAIADDLGVSVASVRQSKSRVLRRLKQEVRERVE